MLFGGPKWQRTHAAGGKSYCYKLTVDMHNFIALNQTLVKQTNKSKLNKEMSQSNLCELKRRKSNMQIIKSKRGMKAKYCHCQSGKTTCHMDI